MLVFALFGLLGVGVLSAILLEDDNADDQPIEGEKIEGTDDSDLLLGGEENDTIFALGDDDLILSGGGDDRVFGGDGGDLIAGQAGDDFIRGSANDDAILAGSGNDTLRGDAGDDILIGIDVVDEDQFSAAIAGALDGSLDLEDLSTQLDSVGNGFIAETGEADTLFGGVGDDILLVGGNDEATGGDGADIFIAGSWMDAGESA